MQMLFRPVGLYELQLIAKAEYRAFPPRLPMQPIFYPVLNQEYAAQIARDWNTKDPNSGYMGAVTAFAVAAEFLAQFPVQQVGATMHQELWIPAERLNELNANLQGVIQVVQAFYGAKFSGTKAW